MVSVLKNERSQAEPGWGHCVVFLGKTLYSNSASLRPGVLMDSSEFNARGTPAMVQHPI